MTQNIYDILRQASQLSLDDTVLEATLENYTPTMIGDFNNQVVEETSAGIIVEADPSKAIIGKARWLLRVLIATAGHAKDHAEAETWPGNIRIIEKDRVKAQLGLVQLAFGSTNPAWQGLYKIQAKLEIVGESDPRDPVYGTHYKGVARPRLMTMGKGERAELLTPIAPGRLRLYIRVTRRRLPASASIKGVNTDRLDALIASLVLAVLRLLGIGSGANRGFGRFHVVNLISKYKDDIPKILRLQARQEQYVVNDIRAAINRLLELTVASIPGAKLNPQAPKRISIIDIKNIRVYVITPCKINSLQNIYRKLPGKKKYGLKCYKGVHRTLEIIAMVSLKASWKILNKEGRSGGGAYHTWILGLPRLQKLNISDICFHKKKVILPTGYMLKEQKDGKQSNKFRKLSDKGMAYVKGETWSKNVEFFAEVRRQSSFVLFPLDADGAYVALIPMFPPDFNDIIGDLHHFGGYVNPRIKKPVFVDAVRVARVAEIASNGINQDVVRCKNKVYVNDAVFGVAEPHTVTHLGKPGKPAPRVGEDELVEAAYSASLEFFDELLG